MRSYSERPRIEAPREVTVEVFSRASLASLIALAVSIAPMIMGVAYAFRPSEHRLALMRPLTLAGIFAATANIFLGLVNALIYLSNANATESARFGLAARGLAEASVMPFIAFACLTVAWLSVAIGMRKTG
jgi:hypothetical protein